jgi:hypothetical protein
MAGKFLRGAFVQFMETFLIPAPNVIIFQFNPESISHGWSPAQTAETDDDNPLAVSGPPSESFDFTLSMDANDMLADGSVVAQGIATLSGIYTRIAALEMLLHPSGGGGTSLLGSVSISSSGISLGGSASGGVKHTVPGAQLPTVLFVWGPGRILPVKLTGLSITETLYDPLLLNPVHAEAKVSLQVLTPRELQHVSGPLADLANMSYKYSKKLREALALANLANSAESIIGLLPI